MKKSNELPYQIHVLVCGNDRKGVSKSCADGNSSKVKDVLKEKLGSLDWARHIRVSLTHCLGLCANGPNIVVYPHGLHFSEVSINDIEAIISELKGIAQS